MKSRYNRSGKVGKWVLVRGTDAYWRSKDGFSRGVSNVYCLAAHGKLPVHSESYKPERGMDHERNLIDWVGGWPFEVARPDEILNYLRSRGFIMEKMETTRHHGNNIFLATRTDIK